ncbi:MAG: damage-control phosphatase ARMT1 family protein [Desulfobacterales bacterium]
MQTYHECIPCFLKQALNAARLATADAHVHEHVLRRVLSDVAGMNLNQPPPLMGRRIHQIIREATGNSDPYAAVKKQYNEFGLSLYPQLKQTIGQSKNPLEAAIRLSIAGNIIDFGLAESVNQAEVASVIEQSLTHPLEGDVSAFQAAMASARNILFLGDNTGEIVFDRLLIETLERDHITYVVRGGPVINDATRADAEFTGITELVDVMDNGSDAPGTILDQCSESFQQAFKDADLVVAKGQGNFESLSDANQHIFFIFKVKCPVVAAHTDCPAGSMMIHEKGMD